MADTPAPAAVSAPTLTLVTSVQTQNNLLAKPWFSPRATWLSLRAVLISAASCMLSITGPLHTFLDKTHPGLASNVGAVALVIIALGSMHLSVSRSIMPNIDNPTINQAQGQETEQNVTDGP